MIIFNVIPSAYCLIIFFNSNTLETICMFINISNQELEVLLFEG